MMRTAATRGLGGRLRLLLFRATNAVPKSFMFGAGVALVLQSSTAVVLLAASFVRKGFISLPAALAVAIGADIGTAFAAQILRLDLAFVAPVAAILGYLCFRSADQRGLKSLGRALLGLAFILLALGLVVEASAPMRSSETLMATLAAIGNEPVLAVLLAALLTWLAHSSLAIVLLIIALASSGAISGTLVLALILGVNLGAALPAIVATATAPASERRVALGNLMFRGSAVMLLLPFVPRVDQLFDTLELSISATAAAQHLAFNVVLAMAALPLSGVAARLLERAVKDTPEAVARTMERRRPRDLESPAGISIEQAIAIAQREALRMADLVYEMVETSLSAFDKDEAVVGPGEIAAIDDQVDAFNESIKFYLTEISRRELTREESTRCMQIFSFVMNLEHIGDVIDGNVIKLASRMRKADLYFSTEGKAELEALHARVVGSLQMATNVFLADDEDLAAHLLEEKHAIGELNRCATLRHLERLRQGNAESIETSAIHVDLLRDFKRISSHTAAIAHSVLDAPLMSSRHAT